jgi:hypothetical protein
VSLDSLKIGTLAGVLKATAGVVSGSATTSDLAEGTNRYFTEARARFALSASSPVVYDNVTGIMSFDAATTALTKYVLKTGDTMTGTLNISTSSDTNALVLKEFAASPTTNIMQVKRSDGTVKWTFNKTNLNTAAATGITLDFDTANGISSSTSRTGLNLRLLPGYVGGNPGGFISALAFDNQAASNDVSVTADASTGFGYRIGGSRGITGFARGPLSPSSASTGYNSGIMVGAGRAAKNFGAWVTATTNATGTNTNVGTFSDGWASNGAVYVGGYFTNKNTGGLPTFESCALCADNDDKTTPIFLARDQGVSVFKILDGGQIAYGTHNALGAEVLSGYITIQDIAGNTRKLAVIS